MEIEVWYAALRPDGEVAQFENSMEDDEGPNPLYLMCPGLDYRKLVEKPNLPPQPSPTCKIKLVGEELVWIETVLLSDVLAAALAKTYVDVDAVYEDAIGKRATEYARAEEAARNYQAADPKPTVVSGYITGHAQNNPTGAVQSNDWAAQQIVERADAFRWAELQMRNVRFARQADMRAATTLEELNAAKSSWLDFIIYLRGLLGLPT